MIKNVDATLIGRTIKIVIPNISGDNNMPEVGTEGKVVAFHPFQGEVFITVKLEKGNYSFRPSELEIVTGKTTRTITVKVTGDEVLYEKTKAAIGEAVKDVGKKKYEWKKEKRTFL